MFSLFFTIKENRIFEAKSRSDKSWLIGGLAWDRPWTKHYWPGKREAIWEKKSFLFWFFPKGRGGMAYVWIQTFWSTFFPPYVWKNFRKRAGGGYLILNFLRFFSVWVWTLSREGGGGAKPKSKHFEELYSI